MLLMDERPYEAALAAALRKLKSRDRFEAEIRSALGSFDADVAEHTIETLKAKRLLDDVRTARNYVAAHGGSKGAERIRQELLARGAAETVIEAALVDQEEGEALNALLRKRFKPQDDPGKAGRYLISRGFEEEAVRDALRGYFETSESSE